MWEHDRRDALLELPDAVFKKWVKGVKVFTINNGDELSLCGTADYDDDDLLPRDRIAAAVPWGKGWRAKVLSKL